MYPRPLTVETACASRALETAGGADVVKALNAETQLALPATGLLADDVTPVAIPVEADSARRNGSSWVSW